FIRKDGREIFGMPIPDALLTDVIKGAPYYDEYLEHVAKYQQHLDAEHGMQNEGGATESPKATKVTKPKVAKVTKPTGDKAPKPTSSQPPKTTPTRKTKSSLKLVDEFVDEGVPEKEHVYDDEEADLQQTLDLSLKDQGERTQGPTRPVVIRETDYGRIQQLLDESLPDQFIFQRRIPMPIESSGHTESPSLDAELALIDSETESDKEAPEIHARDQDEGQAGPNPGEQDEGQAGPNPVEQDEGQAGLNLGDAAESQPQSSHVVHAVPNLEHMDSENLKLPTEDQVIIEEPASSTRTMSSLQNLDKELSFTNQFFVEKPQEEESEKTNTESEV
ncbi:hypothetical protein Tco_0870029, partial [Tanacetum coccineum]